MHKWPKYVALYQLKPLCMFGWIFIDEDYNGGRITVIIPAGALSHLFAINITNDNIAECNETFSLAMKSVSLCGVAIGSDNTSEVVIIDDDG